jgi:nucleoside 2-deoxyribosyltransferase
MRVYVASSFLRKPDVRAMHALLRAAGHEITVDWTGVDASGLEGAAFHAYLARGAELVFGGVVNTDVVIVLHDDRGRGMATEMGLALARGIPVIVVGGRVPQGEMKNVFYYLPPPQVEHVDSTMEALKLLDLYARVRAA